MSVEDIQEYARWIRENMNTESLGTAQSIRCLILILLTGGNYRTTTEVMTNSKLISMSALLVKIYNQFRNEHGETWREELYNAIDRLPNTDDYKNKLLVWMMGLTKKTASNITLPRNEYEEYFGTLMRRFDELSEPLTDDERAYAWLLMVAGSSALTIRGSDKSKNGKMLEGIFLKTMLELLGFTRDVNYWTNLERDAEVERETDAEVQSRRGRIRIELGLIESGNQEVIEDKIARVGERGIVIYDHIGPNSNIGTTAENNNVHLIGVRGNYPLTLLREYLAPLVDIQLRVIPDEHDMLERLLNELSDDFFTIR